MQGQDSEPTGVQPLLQDENSSAAVLDQLRRILDSHAFSNSPRAKEFLSYVVENGLTGHTELLKERSIGINLFHRPPSYVTSDDPIVRVKAGEVRRRLAQYYAEGEHALEVQIEIPVGSYIPRFQWNRSVLPTPLASVELSPPLEHPPQVKRRSWKFWAALSLLLILGVVVAMTIQRRAHQKTPIEEFWAPVFATGQPVLICMPSPVSYALSGDVFKMAGKSHPGLYDSQASRENTPVQLDPNTPLKWGDVRPLVDYYVNKDDAYVATDLAGLFARIHKASQVRAGRDFNYEDLRQSPAVLIGAFNNSWTMPMGAELPFVFREQDGTFGTIVERGGQGRVWRMEGDINHGTKDFAIVARVLNSKTGQFLVVVGGIGMVGTQAAGPFITQPGDFDAALQKAPSGWQGRNLELVLETDVIDATASRPHVVAITTW